MRKARVLVVEDDSTTRFMMSEMCDELGYVIETAEDGAECVSMMEEDPDRADIILMDIHMPNMSGVDACNQVRVTKTNSAKKISIIAMTADEHWHNLAYGRAAGFDGVLSKPISLLRLENLLKQAR